MSSYEKLQGDADPTYPGRISNAEQAKYVAAGVAPELLDTTGCVRSSKFSTVDDASARLSPRVREFDHRLSAVVAQSSDFYRVSLGATVLDHAVVTSSSGQM